jgi:hypothetical protein
MHRQFRLSRKVSAARLYASDELEQIPTSPAVSPNSAAASARAASHCEVPAAAVHAELLVAEVLLQRPAHVGRRDALGGRVQYLP